MSGLAVPNTTFHVFDGSHERSTALLNKSFVQNQVAGPATPPGGMAGIGGSLSRLLIFLKL
jgi:hypothetical protein